jgi:asparagine synthase (glutamine-hydrolysing)
MCGFAGYLGASNSVSRDATSVLNGMGLAILSRGPDDAGSWADNNAGVGLVHRRLAIIDRSAAGHQPMKSSSERFVIAFNGEIYNHLDLRASLEQSSLAPEWRGHSDTETLLAGFSAWGIRNTIERCVGMFAFAAWDRQTRVLTLGRDRLGEKPLYYGWQGSGESACFLFGSELKALKAHPAFRAEIDREALALLMRHSNVPAPYSIYKRIRKLLPGTLLTVSLAAREPQAETYWSLASVATGGVANPFTGSDIQAVDELEALLKLSIRRQMVADVPLGAFLSGGIDSSTVVALMQAQSNRPVKTFTIGFNETGYNEAVHAKAVAQHLGTEHTELYVTPEQAMDVIPRLPSLYCEPFSDSSQIPTFLVSQLARNDVTVSLSGDAGDELFSGYNRYLLTRNLWGKLSKVPTGLRALTARSIRLLSTGQWNQLLNRVQPILPDSFRQANVGDKLHKGASVLTSADAEELYLNLVSHWAPETVVLEATEPATFLTGDRPSLPGLDVVQRMMALDGLTYLPDDILVKLDRAAMGVSLEGRVPFLDHEVVEFAWRLPQSLKLRDGVGKWILREVLYRHVPKELIERPKMGFGIPIDSWLRGPLRDWAEALLDERRLKAEGFFCPMAIRKKWEEHLSGRRDWHNHLWDVLMFQAWLEQNG